MHLLKAIFLSLCLMVFSQLSLSAASPKTDQELEAGYEKQISQTHPELLETFREARAAFDKEDYARAAGLLKYICEKAPESDIASRRYGSALVRLGQQAEGIAALEQAVKLNRSAENLARLAFGLISAPADQHPDPSNITRALELVREYSRMPGGNDADALGIHAQVALAARDSAELKRAVAGLRKVAPETLSTRYFSAIAAALDQRWLAAEREIRLAEKAGLPHEAAERFLASGIGKRAMAWRIAMYIGVAIALWILGLVLLFGMGLLLSKTTLKHAEAADPRTALSDAERKLRQIYRTLINIAGLYYYVSLPVVVFMVIGVVCAAVFVSLMIGWVPIKLLIILLIGALITIAGMVKSLFVRVKAEDPGRPLERAEAEGLWQLTEEVARAVDTRQIDEIRITPGTEVAVYERGSWREKLQNKARRILILGTGVLNGFKQDDFRCVLAHEYGHFSNRDTAGGEIGLRVRSDMIKFYLAMYQAGQATWMNAAFHFLRIYNFIFRRISHGATRLQEILADRVAAQCYGAAALEGGLRHVIQRSIQFDAIANQEIKSGIESSRPLQNLYHLTAPQTDEVTKAFDEMLNRKTTQDDTHPSPMDRFRLVAPLERPAYEPRAGEVWDLFADRNAITTEMTSLLEKQIAAYRNPQSPPALPAAREA